MTLVLGVGRYHYARIYKITLKDPEKKPVSKCFQLNVPYTMTNNC